MPGALLNACRRALPAAALLVATPAVVVAAPTKPRDLAAVAVSSSSIALTWRDTSRREIGFEIERATGATGVFVPVATVVKNTTAWTSTGLVAGTTYRYRVRTVGRRATSAWSNVAAATTPPAGGGGGGDTVPPVMPAWLSATVQGCREVALAWPAATDTGGSGLARYRLYRNGAFLTEVAAPATSATDGGAAPSTTYTYAVAAVDGAGNASNQRLAGAVTTPACTNQPPVADAGPNQMGQSLIALGFDGSGSRDADGAITAYHWTFGDGTTATGMRPSHAYERPGTYTARLTVTDDGGAQASDSATVTIMNRAPTANAGPDRTATAGQAVSLSGAGSSDPDGAIVAWTWTFGDGGTASGANVEHTYAAPGTYTATLTVRDDLGATASDTATVTVTAAGGQGWGKRAGGVADDRAHAVATDAAGNVAVAGYFQGTVSFGGATFTSAHLAHLDPNDYKDAFVAKYDAAGAHVWSRQIGADYDDRANAVAMDAAGNVVVAGSVANYVDFGNGMTTTSQGGLDVFVAKYAAATGAHLWSRRASGTGNEGAYAVAVDAAGDVLVVGHFQGTVDFGGGALAASGGSTDQDLFVAKYAGATGAHLWSRRFGQGAAFDYGYGIAADAAGNVLVTGSFWGTVDFGAGNLSSAGRYDGFALRLSPTGATRWARRFGGPNDDWGLAVATDGSGDALVAGAFSGTASFGGGPRASAGGEDAFVVRLGAADGAHQWSSRYGGAGTDRAEAVAVDGAGTVHVAGYTQGGMNLGGATLPHAGGYDAFFARLTPAGAHLWSRAFGGTGFDYGKATAASGGAVVGAGYFQRTADFGSGPVTSAGGFDAYVFRLTP